MKDKSNLASILYKELVEYDVKLYQYFRMSKSQKLQSLPMQGGYASVNNCNARDTFKNYFNFPEGSLPCQLQKC